MKNILLVFGGESYEHDISVVTAFQIYKKTRIEGIKLLLFYISRDGRFFICDDKKLNIDNFSKENFNDKNKLFHEVFFVGGEKQKLFKKTRFGLKEFLKVNVSIFACHGGDGENGKIVNLFEQFGIKTSAGSSDALAICMDKFVFKNFAKGLTVPVVPGFRLCKNDFDNNENFYIGKVKKYGFPIIIKINSGGSSIGLFVAKDIEEFQQKINEAFEFDEFVIVEKFINNAREFNVAVLGDKCSYEISEIDEPLKQNEVLTFADKYLSGGKCDKSGSKSMASSIRKFPTDLPLELCNKIKSLAKKLFIGLNLRGIIRIDFLYDQDNDKLYVCEVNAIPGSLAFYFFKKNKILVNSLVNKLIEIAENSCNFHIKQDYSTNILDKRNSL